MMYKPQKEVSYMYVVNSSCRICGSTNGAKCSDMSVTVPAGEVPSGLTACGYESGLVRLPKVTVTEQTYSEGFCPDTALCHGTLFPELVSEY